MNRHSFSAIFIVGVNCDLWKHITERLVFWKKNVLFPNDVFRLTSEHERDNSPKISPDDIISEHYWSFYDIDNTPPNDTFSLLTASITLAYTTTTHNRITKHLNFSSVFIARTYNFLKLWKDKSTLYIICWFCSMHDEGNILSKQTI